jgi:aldehyde:ferredoxin oxidoreductase
VICLFNAMPVPESVQFEFYKAITGWNLTPEKWYGEIALRMVAMQRAALLLGGPDVKWTPADDDNPPRFYEPLPSGPKKGQATDKAKVKELKKKYYEAVGWDENGIPKSSTLKKLGIENVDRALSKVRK